MSDLETDDESIDTWTPPFTKPALSHEESIKVLLNIDKDIKYFGDRDQHILKEIIKRFRQDDQSLKPCKFSLETSVQLLVWGFDQLHKKGLCI